MSIRTNCPHCGSYSAARSSREISLVMREINYQCMNTRCGYTFVALLQIVRGLSPPAVENSAVSVPMSRRVVAGDDG